MSVVNIGFSAAASWNVGRGNGRAFADRADPRARVRGCSHTVLASCVRVRSLALALLHSLLVRGREGHSGLARRDCHRTDGGGGKGDDMAKVSGGETSHEASDAVTRPWSITSGLIFGGARYYRIIIPRFRPL